MTTTPDTLAKLAADNLPERIYLVLGEDIAPDDDPRADFDDLADVTWCIDKQFDNDVEYVRADVAALTAQALPAAEPTRPANSQDWAGMDGATAYWLIERHAEGWADIALMMGEWLAANQAAQQAAQATAGWVPSEAKELLRAGVVCHDLGHVSVSAVQRHLAIGWNRAKELCEQLIGLRLVDGLDATSPHLAAALPQPQPQSAQSKGDAA